MRTLSLVALVLAISACEKKVPPFSAHQVPQPIENSQAIDSGFQRCLSMFGSSTSVSADFEGLQQVQAMMECSESYLAQSPEGSNVEDAERLRRKAAIASLEILRDLNEKIVSPSPIDAAGAMAQSKLIEREQLAKQARQNATYLRRAVHYETVQVFRGAFRELRAEGYTMGDAIKEQESANARFRQQGIWEFPVLTQYEGGKFITVLETLDQAVAPKFLIGGYGVVQPNTLIQDENFEISGVFSRDCQVSVWSGEEVAFKIPCDKYLAAAERAQLAKQTKDGIEAQVKNKAHEEMVAKP